MFWMIHDPHGNPHGYWIQNIHLCYCSQRQMSHEYKKRFRIKIRQAFSGFAMYLLLMRLILASLECADGEHGNGKIQLLPVASKIAAKMDICRF